MAFYQNLDYWPRSREIMYLVASVCRYPLSWLNCLTYDLDIRYVGWLWLGWDCRSRSWSNAKNHVLTSLLPSFKVRVKIILKVKGQIQISGWQQSILGARLCRVQQRAQKNHDQSNVFVCVASNRADAFDRLLIKIYAPFPLTVAWLVSLPQSRRASYA